MQSAPPSPSGPDPDWEHFRLYERVVEALYAVPFHFRSGTIIDGVLATDLQTLNQVLGATIEEQMVSTLNRMRNVWDPDDRYLRYSFVRQAQVFPDVLLKADANGEAIILGIELKGWYLLAKESEPNFRFQVTPAVCAPGDLLVVVPWALNRVLSGTPVSFRPFVASARYAAEFRNYWWTNVRRSAQDRGITMPGSVPEYPQKGDQILDRPTADRGGNFGRIARTGLMDEYVEKMKQTTLAGIPTGEWLTFLKQFKQ